MRIAQEAIDRHAAHGHGDQKAITWLGKKGERIELTYSTLDSLSNQFANLLAELGVEPGDRVYFLVSPNSLRYFSPRFRTIKGITYPYSSADTRSQDRNDELPRRRGIALAPKQCGSPRRHPREASGGVHFGLARKVLPARR
jgi:hypothetical protein